MQICEINQCTGCSACIDACPKKCIEMKKNEYGYEYPVCDEESCIHCGACKRVCQANNHTIEFKLPIKSYAAALKNQEIRKKSASGGIAYALYQKIISEGGIGYGVIFDEDFHLAFQRIDQEKDIMQFQGSKYTYSDMRGTYKAVKKDLDNDRRVLFIGTSCQCGGLLTFLGKKYSNLITVDLICHGMPAADFLIEYLDDVERKSKKKVTNISFRDNDKFEMKVFSEEEILVCEPAKENLYMAAYTQMLIYRDCCYKCQYARPERITDITIGDYWGNDRRNMLSPSENGKSVILTNSQCGTGLVESCMDTLVLTLKRYDDIVNMNEQLSHPSKECEYRKKLLQCIKEKGYVEAARSIIPQVLQGKNMKNTLLKRGYYKAKYKIKACYQYLTDMNHRGRFFREHIRNKWDRKRLTNKDFTILCNTCIGGIISHDLGLQFKSPTVNLYMTPTDFVKFLENISYYSKLDIVPVPYDKDYPVGMLGDIRIYFKHYASIEEAIQKWKERTARINYENIFVMMTDRWCCPKTTLERFERLPFENKICFTAKDYPEYPHCVQVKKHSDNGCVWIITNIMNLFGKRLYQYAKGFDYVRWLNKGKRK